MTLTDSQATPAFAAFNLMAERYDDLFTHTSIGHLQRRVVWDALAQAFSPGDYLLELNCGTGEDAFFLARRGISVTSCDAASAMIAVAQQKKDLEGGCANLEFRVLANEDLQELRGQHDFDGAFSNFSGLNCVADRHAVAAELASLLRRGARLLTCFSTRLCLWEICWYMAHGDSRKAFRRTAGSSIAQLQGVSVPVWYPTISQIRRDFNPWFQLKSIRAVGLFVPPSYLEAWARRHKQTLAVLAKMDRLLARLPLLRALGDHVLLEFERTLS